MKQHLQSQYAVNQPGGTEFESELECFLEDLFGQMGVPTGSIGARTDSLMELLDLYGELVDLYTDLAVEQSGQREKYHSRLRLIGLSEAQILEILW
jgi:hypothetical protein